MAGDGQLQASLLQIATFSTQVRLELEQLTVTQGSLLRLAKVQVLVLPLLLAGFFLHAVLTVRPRKEAKQAKQVRMSHSMMLALGSTLLLDFFATDQYQPSMPDMARDFAVTRVQMGATIQLHLFVSALFMLLFGPLSDVIGRRPVILGSQLLLTVSTLCCACADAFSWFLLGRVFQGMAAAATPVIMATIPDCYEDMPQRLRAQGVLGMIMQLGPLVAPAAGGFLAAVFDWRCPFFMLSGLSLLLLIFSVWAIEETGRAAEITSYSACARRTVLCRSRFCILLACTFVKTFFDAMVSQNGFIFRDDLNLSIQGTSICITATAACGILGSCVPALLPWTALATMRASLIPLLLSGLSLGVVGTLAGHSLFWIMACICCACVVIWAPWMAASCQFTEGISDIAGLANSLLTALSFLGSSLTSLAVVVVAKGSIPGSFCALGATLMLVALSLWLGPLEGALPGASPSPSADGTSKVH